ncbi:hypothetical protein [Flavobacterium cheniae]|jgi:hypothetical protein|uniref:YD repeat-containing protein n=1 Tax=Flavobacterium cheniae TaxID=295428 RepID=A0A562KFN0_9FLAO|nr:hypothetical protein [Flavobacterium cheniae]TDR20895.1 hypothetical protein C8D80_2134 [Flavobacterium cheniae]TWH94229.1 hypothetical protein IP97_01787 [Flavobacterium cheniae]
MKTRIILILTLCFSLLVTAQNKESFNEIPIVAFKVTIDSDTEIKLKFGNFANLDNLNNVEIKNTSKSITKKDTIKTFDNKNRVIQKMINIANTRSFEYLSNVTYDDILNIRLEKVNHGHIDTTAAGKLEIKNNQILSSENVLYYIMDEEFNVYQNKKLVISLITEHYDRVQHIFYFEYNSNGDIIRIDDEVPTKKLVEDFKQGKPITPRNFVNTPIKNGSIIYKYIYDKQNNWIERKMFKIENNKEVLIETHRK